MFWKNSLSLGKRLLSFEKCPWVREKEVVFNELSCKKTRFNKCFVTWIKGFIPYIAPTSWVFNQNRQNSSIRLSFERKLVEKASVPWVFAPKLAWVFQGLSFFFSLSLEKTHKKAWPNCFHSGFQFYKFKNYHHVLLRIFFFKSFSSNQFLGLEMRKLVPEANLLSVWYHFGFVYTWGWFLNWFYQCMWNLTKFMSCLKSWIPGNAGREPLVPIRFGIGN